MIFANSTPFSEIVSSVLTEVGKKVTELKPGQLGVFDKKTHKSINPATLSDNKKREVRILVGSHNLGERNYLKVPGSSISNVANLYEAYTTQYFSPDSVLDIYRLNPVEGKPYIYYYGFNGTNDCESIQIECGKNYEFEFATEGSRVKTITGQDVYVKRYSEDSPCCSNDCTESCEDKTDCKSTVEKIVFKANQDPILSRLWKFSVVSSCDTENVVEKFPHFDWCIEKCDTGDDKALLNVKSNYPLYHVERTHREGSTSKYKMYCVPEDVTPEPLVGTVGSKIPTCNNECPVGYTLTNCVKNYTVSRPLSGDEDLTTDATKQAYALAVGTEYNTSMAEFMSFNGSVAVIKIKLPCDFPEPLAVKADVLVYTFQEDPYCVSNSTTQCKWVKCGCSYKVKRKLCITIPHDPCFDSCNPVPEPTDFPFLKELEEFVKIHPELVQGSFKGEQLEKCLSTYSVEQYNNECLVDGCDTKDGNITYNNIPAFKGRLWTECPCVVEENNNTNCLCGIKAEAILNDSCIENCWTNLNEYHEESYPRIYIAQTNPWSTFNKCNHFGSKDWVAQEYEITTGQGWKVAKEVLLSRQYFLQKYFDTSTILGLMINSATGIVRDIDQCSSYFSLRLIIDFSVPSNLSSSYGNNLQYITLFFADKAVRTQVENLLDSFVSSGYKGLTTRDFYNT